MNDNQRTSIATGVSLLEQADKFHFLSIALTIAASTILFASSLLPQLSGGWFFSLLLIVLLGAIELFYSIRVGFDKALLSLLAKENVAIDDGLAQLDKALMALKLLPPEKAGRELEKRLLGCLKLFKLQLILCCLQLAVVIVAAAFSFLNS